MKLAHIVSEFRKGLLNSKPSKAMCFAVSSSLAGYLHFTGYECDLTKGTIGDWEHWWITLPDGTIIDATADQFQKPDGSKMPEVYIGTRPKWYLVGGIEE